MWEFSRAKSEVFKLRMPPLVPDPGITRGGILKKVQQQNFASGEKIPKFERFRVLLIAVNVFKMLFFISDNPQSQYRLVL